MSKLIPIVQSPEDLCFSSKSAEDCQQSHSDISYEYLLAVRLLFLRSLPAQYSLDRHDETAGIDG